MKVIILQHVSFERPGLILNWLEACRYEYKIVETFSASEFPKIEDFDCLIIMGGPMGVYEEKQYPWMKKEKIFIKEAIRSKKKVLGICLGAQLIAEALGAKVSKLNYSEHGWLPIQVLDSKHDMTVFQLHGDGFEIPNGAKLLASSEVHKNQAFSYQDHVLALQYHPEMTKELLAEIEVNSDFEASIFHTNDKDIESCKGYLYKVLDDFTKIKSKKLYY